MDFTGIKRRMHAIPDWLKTGLVCLLEIIVVFFFSNLMLIVEAMGPLYAKVGLLEAYFSVIKIHAQSGEILTLVCALVAPVVFWVIFEEKKRLVKGLIIIALILIYLFATIIQFKSGVIFRIEAFDIYVGAVFLWVCSVFVGNFPPDVKGYGPVMDEEAKSFINLTKGYR